MTMVVEGSRRARSLVGLFSEPIEASKESSDKADMLDFVGSGLSKLGLYLGKPKYLKDAFILFSEQVQHVIWLYTYLRVDLLT